MASQKTRRSRKDAESYQVVQGRQTVEPLLDGVDFVEDAALLIGKPFPLVEVLP